MMLKTLQIARSRVAAGPLTQRFNAIPQQVMPCLTMQPMIGMMNMRMFSAAAVARAPLQIRVTKNAFTDELSSLEQILPKSTTVHPECFFPDKVKQPENPKWIARKFDIHYSVYKLNAAAMLCRKKHIHDALTLIQNVAKKGGKLVKSVLEAARVNGQKKGYSEERMYVKEIVLGKALGPKKIDIRARGKMGMIHAPRSSITVILEEKSTADFYKMLVTGNAPPAVGDTFRKMLYQNDADFEKVKALSYLTTS